MLLARPPAILIACARREKPAEHAMFGVEHRQMLIRDRLTAFWADPPREFRDLRGVQIVRGRDAFEAERQQFRRGYRVGCVQAEIARQLAKVREMSWAIPQRMQQPGGTHQNRNL